MHGRKKLELNTLKGITRYKGKRSSGSIWFEIDNVCAEKNYRMSPINQSGNNSTGIVGRKNYSCTMFLDRTAYIQKTIYIALPLLQEYYKLWETDT